MLGSRLQNYFTTLTAGLEDASITRTDYGPNQYLQMYTFRPNVSVAQPTRRTTNLDLTRVWGEPIPLLWGHTRVQCSPIWSSVPQERVEIPNVIGQVGFSMNMPDVYAP